MGGYQTRRGGPQGIEPLKWERVEERKGQCSLCSLPPSPLTGLSSIPAGGGDTGFIRVHGALRKPHPIYMVLAQWLYCGLTGISCRFRPERVC